MGLFDTGQVTKLILESFTDAAFQNKKGEPFTVMVNPESITRNKTLNYHEVSNTTADKAGVFVGTAPEDYSISILLDSTGVIKDAKLLNVAITNPFDSSPPEEVSEKVNQLLTTCCYIDGEEHRPLFVKITYGDEAGFFKGALKSYKIDYKLFRPDGKPIRAIVTLNFKEIRSETEVVALLNSPDITHKRVFKSHDHFTLLGNKIYKDLNYYTDVAKANGMSSFRRIEQGTEIFFPPIK